MILSVKKNLGILFLFLLLSWNAYSEECIEGNCDNGNGTYIYSNGSKYVGEFKNSMPNGKGRLISEVGTIFANWVDNTPTGTVIFTAKRGDEYVGEMKNGLQHGFGTYKYPNGDKYTGDWKMGEMDGKGEYFFSDGGKYIGDWKNGIQNGVGIQIWANGDSYSGEIKNNQSHGYGVKTDKIASCEGNFINNKMNGEFLCIFHNTGKAVISEVSNGKIINQYLVTRNNKEIDYIKNPNANYKPRLYYNNLTGGMNECAHDPGISGKCVSFKPFNKNSYDKDTLFYNPKTGAMQTCFGNVSITGKCLAYGNFNHSKAVKDKGQLYYNPKSKKMTTCKFVDLKGICKHYDLVPNSWAKNDGGFRMTDQNNPYYKRVPQSSQDLIDLGMRMINGGCTFGINC